VDSHKERACPHYPQPYDDGDDAPLSWLGVLGTLPEEDHNKHSLKWYNFLGELPVSIGVHRHRGDEEYYYVISGRGLMTLDGEQFEVEAGDITAVYPGGTHGLENNADEDLRILVISAH